MRRNQHSDSASRQSRTRRRLRRRDNEAGAPMTADTIFRLYSVIKPIICSAMMTLLEEGRFTLIDPLAKYIPAFGVRIPLSCRFDN
jgi:CubicO group peptidase (beta-lactamase class C family)